VGIETKSIGTLIDELNTTNMKLYAAQEPGSPATLAEIKALNKRRNELIRAIDRVLKDPNSPTEKTY